MQLPGLYSVHRPTAFAPLFCDFLRFMDRLLNHRVHVISAFCRAAIRNWPLSVEGATNTLDVTHVSDVADCILDVADCLSAGKSLTPIHLTTGQGVSLMDLAHLILRLSQNNSQIVTATRRAFDVSCFIGNPEFAQSQIGWSPKVSLETGLRDLIAQLRNGDAA